MCLVTNSMTLVRAKIETSIPRKRKGLCDQHTRVRTHHSDNGPCLSVASLQMVVICRLHLCKWLLFVGCILANGRYLSVASRQMVIICRLHLCKWSLFVGCISANGCWLSVASPQMVVCRLHLRKWSFVGCISANGRCLSVASPQMVVCRLHIRKWLLFVGCISATCEGISGTDLL